ncbi:hypothetical protein BJ684DRAFT_15482 [Piptocephalis cylindrospora]|uniref:Alpha and gamma adaptin binding protein p34-domain-containing protein n=1 Tax=Piptocephalis cylindrospora TaxID=1907219 RepID=A0A4P9Y5F1_9FUNG|nr:hypothetical protein BJ684DRAFT_15482 [Piptocephalis cylindrospora]|eukprot:RKP14175.1 hypothetical protein BJ684DRAFT_15482 [Piptocephalis cylindrospora]
MSGLPGTIQVLSPSREGAERVMQDMLQARGEEPTLRKGQQRVPWTLKTKYYTARVEVKLGSWREEEEEAEAVVLALEPSQTSDYSDFLKEAEAFFQDRQPDIRVLAWYGADEEKKDGSSKEMEDMSTWCIEHEVELVPMKVEEEEEEEQDNEPEWKGRRGKDRVVEVLECHVWSSAVMVSKSKGVTKDKGEAEEDGFGEFQSTEKEFRDDLDDRLHRLSLPDEDEEGGEMEGMDMEHAFAQLLSFKDNWEDLSKDERRKRADQIAESFVDMLEDEDEDGEE